MRTALIIGAILGTILGLYEIFKEKKTKGRIEKERGSSAYVKVEYLGGHPLNSSGIKGDLGALSVEKDKVIYMLKDFVSTELNDKVFEIDIDKITNCSVETKESLSANGFSWFACVWIKERQKIY